MDRFLIKSPSKTADGPTDLDAASPGPVQKRPKLDNAADQDNKSLTAEADPGLKPNDKVEDCSGDPVDECQFGKKCYRRNIHHFEEFAHPHLEELMEIMEALGDPSEIPAEYDPDCDRQVLQDQMQVIRTLKRRKKAHGGQSSPKPGTYAGSVPVTPQRSVTASRTPGKADKNSPLAKWEAAAPYHMFLTSIGPEQTFFSMSFTDLFDSSFGEIKSVCHINFMIETDWLMDRVTRSTLWGTPMMLIHGTDNPNVPLIARENDWIEQYRMKTPHPFGHHHSKMSMIEYTDSSIRILVYTANLIEGDWLNKTQGIWISPKCSKIVDAEDVPKGESPTGFRADFITYLRSYYLKALDGWIDKIKRADMSSIRVFFVASAPNVTQSLSSTGFQWGIKKVEKILSRYQTSQVTSQWPVITQCSSIGSLGPDISWLQNEWASYFDGPIKTKPSVKLVYPSVEDVQKSADGIDGADCLPYAHMVHSKQIWLESIMCKWVGFRYNRTYAMPHIKTYCRVSPDFQQMAWFILTSANLSKAAWGKLNKKRDQLQVMSWEAGVMFMPKLFNAGPSFRGKIEPIDNGSRASSRISSDRGTVGYPFPVPYDLPTHPYSSGTKPWLVDYLGRPRRQKTKVTSPD